MDTLKNKIFEELCDIWFTQNVTVFVYGPRKAYHVHVWLDKGSGRC